MGEESLYLVLAVLFLVSDDQVRAQGMDDIRADILGAADPGLMAEPGLWMDAEFGDAYYFFFQAQRI